MIKFTNTMYSEFTTTMYRPREYNKNEKQYKVWIHKYVSPAIQPK
jgi:hypothetical protein